MPELTGSEPTRPEPAGREVARPELTRREVALLRATADRRVELTCSSEPDLRVDSLPFCDPQAARALVHRGLIEPVTEAPPGTPVPARLTPAGVTALGLVGV